MKERPILFSGPMVRAILEGKKTVTRRVVKSQPLETLPNDEEYETHSVHRARGWAWRPKRGWSCFTSLGQKHLAEMMVKHCPYGKPGDRLWVRETAIPDCPSEFHEFHNETWRSVPDEFRTPKHVFYQATASEPSSFLWKPSIHMPRWASRILLEVVSGRVERLQEITKESAEREGVDFMRHFPDSDPSFGARMLFEGLWDSINAKRGFGWDANPWVWVVEFRRVA